VTRARARAFAAVLVAAHAGWLVAGPWLPELAASVWLDGAGGPVASAAFRFALAPILAVALAVSYLAPGLLLRVPGRGESLAAWVLLAAPAAVLIQVAIASAAKLIGNPASPWIVKVLQLTVEAGLAWRLVRLGGGAVERSGGGAIGPPAAAGQQSAASRKQRAEAGGPAGPAPQPAAGGPALLVAVLVCAGATALFGDALFVRELGSDGVESLDMGASLASRYLPRTPTASGLVGLGVGMIAQAFPAYWFTTVVGACEAAPRLPVVVFLPVVLLGVVALSERGLGRRLSWTALVAASTAVLCGSAMLAFNASFDPYHAELASPAALDAMTVAMMMGVVVAFLDRRAGWLLSCAGIAHFCRPSGLLLLLVLGACAFVVDRGARLRRAALAAAAAAFCVGLTLLYEKVYVPRVIEGGALGLDAGSLLGRLRYLSFTDGQRLAIVAFASGIFPWFAFLRFRRLDPDGKLVALVCLALLAFFFLPASYAPHHFAPTFALAQVPFWRLLADRATEAERTRWTLVALVLAASALAWIVPWHDPPQPLRALGRSIAIDLPVRGPLARDLIEVAAPLEHLVALPWTEADPASELVGSPLVLAWYARHARRAEAPAFRVAAARDAPPEGWEPVSVRGGAILLARDRSRVVEARGGHPTGFARTIFAVPRDRIFPALMVKRRRYDVDVKSLLSR
jgi:hypothetical protein